MDDGRRGKPGEAVMFRDSRERFRIGVLVPYTNTSLEPDLAMMRPAGVSIHVTRISGYEPSGVPGLDEMRAMGESAIADAVALFAPTRPDVLLYGCTSATLALGYDGDRAFAAGLERVVGCPAVTASGAIVWALERLGAARVLFATPYDAALTAEGAAFLESAGVTVRATAYPESAPDSLGQSAMTPDDVVNLVAGSRYRGADAIVIACTALRAVEAIPRIEALTGLPVVTSNQALFAAALDRLKLPMRTIVGKLADSLPGAAPHPLAFLSP